MKVQMKENDWNFENGKEKLWWAEDPVSGRLFFTSPMSPLPVGYVRRSTTNPKEMDRVYNRMHEQEREQNERLILKLFSRGREYYEKVRSRLRDRLNSAGVHDAEKNIIRATLRMMDENDSKMQRNTVYGVSSMQESEAPLPPRRRVII